MFDCRLSFERGGDIPGTNLNDRYLPSRVGNEAPCFMNRAARVGPLAHIAEMRTDSAILNWESSQDRSALRGCIWHASDDRAKRLVKATGDLAGVSRP